MRTDNLSRQNVTTPTFTQNACETLWKTTATTLRDLVCGWRPYTIKQFVSVRWKGDIANFGKDERVYMKQCHIWQNVDFEANMV